ncbi:ShlB/FhaC/HecB family hemolysin secretion/activation protein [Kosakonia cowanii]|uniref:ShlB/FhaC/HecB family hemolysin secretion/activation protein n=1 Tax=Kosakonia cowanii TaxID=208223 RepID=UPI00406289F2
MRAIVIVRFYKLYLFVFFACFHVVAADNLDKFAKDQQLNDSNVLRENKLEKKDVFSPKRELIIDNIQIPEDKVCYRIDQFTLSNDFINDHNIDAIIHKFSGKCLGVNGIRSIAKIIQDYFINAGFVTTRVDVPNQDLNTGRLFLTIAPGRIEHIVVESEDVNSHALPFSEGEILNLRDIEQGLENLQRTPAVDVKINIAPGSRIGYSNIVINTHRTKKWIARASYSNWGDKSTGQNISGAAFYFFNIAGLSDVGYFSGSSSTTGGYKNLTGWYSFPYGFWDYEFVYSTSFSNQNIAIADWNYDYIGRNEYYGFKSSRLLFRDMSKKLSASLEIFKRKADYEFGGVKLAMQKRDMSNVKLALNYIQSFDGASLDSTLSWQRFVKWPGGRETPDMLSGDVDSASHLFNLNMTYLKALQLTSLPSWYEMTFGAQYSPESLTIQDQFNIGSRWSVRGFENSSGVDAINGFYIRNTFNFSTALNGINTFFGADYGQVESSQTTRQLYGGEKLVGITGGVKGHVNSLGYELSLALPLLHPSKMIVDDFTTSFNISYQL